MKLTNLLGHDEAVSPVIGVILMVAITVILAAVIGTFVLGLGDQVQDTAPQASFTFDYEKDANSGGDVLDITHDGGDTISASSLNVSIADAENDGSGGAIEFGGGDQSVTGDVEFPTNGTLYTDSGDVTAGNTDEIQYGDFHIESSGAASTNSDTDLDLSAATVRVVFKSGSDNSATLGQFEGPDA
jgi:flagellin-like protein